MWAIIGEELMKLEKMQWIASGGDEKILVLVRLRPLSEKEIARNEVADWECINDTTILCRNSLLERPGLPTAYAFGKKILILSSLSKFKLVFGLGCGNITVEAFCRV